MLARSGAEPTDTVIPAGRLIGNALATSVTAIQKESPKTPELAKDQRTLAFRTQDLKDTPLPTKDETKDALAKAAKAMNEAVKELRSQKADTAVPKQEQALKALEEAKKQTADKIAELEKRKEDLAKLEEAFDCRLPRRA